MLVYDQGTPLFRDGRRCPFTRGRYHYRNLLWRFWWRRVATQDEHRTYTNGGG